MTLVDAFLREQCDRLGFDWLDGEDSWSTVLHTPRFPSSRHVIALVHAGAGSELKLVVKLPRRPGDDGGIRKEAASLRLLEALSPDAAQRAPRVLALTRFGDQALLAETAVNGRLLAHRLVRADAQRAVREGVALVRSLPTTAAPADDAAWFERLLEEPMARAADAAHSWLPLRSLVETSTALLAPLQQASFPLVFEHGDVAHPNLVLKPDDTLAAIDWERSEDRGLPLLDMSFLLQYLAEARTGISDRIGRCQVFDGAFLPPRGWARPILFEELDRLGIARDLLAPLVLAAWIRSSTSLLGRLWGEARTGHDDGAPVDGAAVAASFAQDRDFALWRHVVTRVPELARA
jgi:aminoglycoside phosphotransferase